GVFVATKVKGAVRALALAVHHALQGVQRIKGGHAPAKHVGAGVKALYFGEVGGAWHGVQVGFHADLGPHAHDGLADGFIVDVAIVRAIQGEGQGIVVTGFFQQFLGAILAVRQALGQFLGVAVNLRGHHGAGGGGGTAHHGFLDGFNVDGHIQGFTHTLVSKGVLALDAAVFQLWILLVQTQIDGAVLVAFHNLGLLAQTLQVLRRRVQNQVHFARQQGGGTGGVLLDRDVDHFGDITHLVALVPPFFVFDKDGAHVHFTRLQLVRAGTVGVASRVGFFVLVQVLGLGHIVLFRPGLVHDEHTGQLAQQNRVGSGSNNVHRLVVHFFCLDDPVHVGLEVGRR